MVAIVSTITPTRIGRNWIPLKKPVGSIRDGGFAGWYDIAIGNPDRIGYKLRLTQPLS